MDCPLEITGLILTKAILPAGKSTWYYTGAPKLKPICKNTRSPVKAKYLQQLCCRVYYYMLVCKTWHQALKEYDNHEWFDNLAYTLYVYAYPGTTLRRNKWWAQCETKVREFASLERIVFWNSSSKNTCYWEWKHCPA